MGCAVGREQAAGRYKRNMFDASHQAPKEQDALETGEHLPFIISGAEADNEAAEIYGPQYYAQRKPIPYERSVRWLRIFALLADKIVRTLAPRSALDVGCAMGFLVEALRDRGVDAWGIDASSYAVSKVRADIRRYCVSASVVNLRSGNFDLVTCIETLEYLDADHLSRALANVTAMSDRILLSTMFDSAEPARVAVRPIAEWIELFAEFGFFPDFSYDASFISPYAILFRRGFSPQPKIYGNHAAHAFAPSGGFQYQAISGLRKPGRALILSGQAGPTFHYRCEHLAEEFAFLGWGADSTFFGDDPGYLKDLLKYDVVVLHRLPCFPQVAAIIREVRNHQKQVWFDVDDLVFSDAAVEEMPGAREHIQIRTRYLRRAALFCDAIKSSSGVLVSTDPLKDEIQERFPDVPVWVKRNAVSDIMVAAAEWVIRIRSRPDGITRLGYFSGTPTHDRDFAECCSPMLHIMERYRRVKLILAGPVDVPDPLLPLIDRIEFFPLVSWRELPILLSRADINLAPLEANSRYTECKSELKYLEAGLLGRPTIASNSGGFRMAVQSGENGFLCATEEEWMEALETLVTKMDSCERMGLHARNDVLAQHTTRARSAELQAILLEAT
jgi:glycosyltransferase involved in cell wall biosynthesis/2-polyprenyl-3-methyl-5-hydroxy-6-metoxy-1,4-benzoquinol methylase